MNKPYDNQFIANEIEDAYLSHLDLQPFFTVYNDLEGTPGMQVLVNKYTTTVGTEKLPVSKGNTKSIEVTAASTPYKIVVAQNRFIYYDEEEMADPMIVFTGIEKASADLFNTVNGDIFAELNKGKTTVTAGAFNFDAFVDVLAQLNVEDSADENIGLYGFVSPADMAEVRKQLNVNLQYVEDFVRTGYVGTVAGINLYVKKDAPAGTIVVATPKAVSLFNKRGVEVEQQREANTRANQIYTRKYYVAALTDETQVVKLAKAQG